MKQYKIAVDENILIKNQICTAGSKMLYNFNSPYSATVVDRVIAASMTICGRIKTDEFGAASSSELNNCDVAFGLDVNGDAYKYALNNSIIYIKPTYGTVSRFGVVANVSSMDQVGIYTKNIDDAFAVLSVIAGHDPNDGTSYPTPKYTYSADGIDAKSLKTTEFADVSDTLFGDCLEAVYCILSTAEFSCNISRFDGLKFGYRTENYKNVNDVVVNSRSESFTTKTKIKALMGTYVLSEGQYDKYYYKAMQIRRLVKERLTELFKQTDFIAVPVGHILASLTGCPSITINGIQLIADDFNENKLYAMAKGVYNNEV